MYDQDLEAGLAWSVIDVNITKVIWMSNNQSRSLQQVD